MRKILLVGAVIGAIGAAAPAWAQYGPSYGGGAYGGSQTWTGGPVPGTYGQQMYTSPGPDGGRIAGGPTPGGGEMYTYTPNGNPAADCATSAACGYGLGYNPLNR